MIRRLSADAKAYIRTGVALTSLAQAVEELVLNSIDAGATSIAVRVDLSCFKIQVVDNGGGINRDQFQLIGERYSTSKCHTVEDLNNLRYFGYRGEALASLRKASAFLEIISRARTSSITYSKCFQNGKVLDIIESPLPRPSAGTTITAHDLFYNLPVRRKCVNEGLEVEKIRYRLAGIALAWPHISISLRDDSVGHVILQTRKGSGMAATFSTIFTTARAKGLMEVSAEKDEFKMFGLVSKESYSRKDLQFIFINKRLVLKSSIHRQVNKILSRSLILRRKGLGSEASERLPISFNTGSPVKQSERYGIFAINVECPFSSYDITFDPSKTLVEFRDWPKLIHLLQDMLYGFLRKENLIFVPEPTSSVSPNDGNSSNDDDEGEHDDVCEDDENKNNTQHECSNLDETQNAVINRDKRNPQLEMENCLFSKPARRPRQLDSPTQEETVSLDIQNQPTASAVHLSTHRNKNDAKRVKHATAAGSSDIAVASDREVSHSVNHDIIDEVSDQTKKPDFQQQPPKNLRDSNKRLLEASGEGVKSKVPKNDNVTTGIQRNNTSLSLQTTSEATSATYTQLGSTLLTSTQVATNPQFTHMKKKNEITLGNSVNYSSTLKSLRDINPSRTSTSISEIITNTLQQLKKSTHKTTDETKDVYKTPVKSSGMKKLDEALPSPPKVSRMEGNCNSFSEYDDRSFTLPETSRRIEHSEKEINQSFVSNIHLDNTKSTMPHTSNQKSQQTSSKSSPVSLSHSDLQTPVAYRSTTEERAQGQHDRLHSRNGVGQTHKQSVRHKQSHASKLARLMRGEKVRESRQDVDEPGDSSDRTRHAKILQSFSFSKQNKHNLNTESLNDTGQMSSNSTTDTRYTETNHHRQRQGMSKDIDDDDHVDAATSLNSMTADNCGKCLINQQIDNSRKPLIRQYSEDPGNKIIIRRQKSDSVTVSELDGERNHCQCYRRLPRQCGSQAGPSGDSLPFSVYQAPEDVIQRPDGGMNNSPKVSVILSLPIDSGRSDAVQCRNTSRSTAKPVWSNSLKLHTNSCVEIQDSTVNGGGDSDEGKTACDPCFQSQGFTAHTDHSNSMKNPSSFSSDTQSERSGCHSEGFSLNLNSTSSGLCPKFNPTPESSRSSPQLSQGFCLSTQKDWIGDETSSENVYSLTQNSEKIENAECEKTGYDSSGFSPAIERLTDTDEETSSHIITKTDNSEKSHDEEDKVSSNTVSDSDSDWYILKPLDSKVQSPAEKSNSESEDVVVKEHQSICMSNTNRNEKYSQSQKPLQTCDVPESVYFSIPAKRSNIAGSNQHRLLHEAAITPNLNCEGLGEPHILAYDSMNNLCEVNTIPETEDFDDPELHRSSAADTRINCLDANSCATTRKTFPDPYGRKDENPDSLVIDAKRILKNMCNVLKGNFSKTNVSVAITKHESSNNALLYANFDSATSSNRSMLPVTDQLLKTVNLNKSPCALQEESLISESMFSYEKALTKASLTPVKTCEPSELDHNIRHEIYNTSLNSSDYNMIDVCSVESLPCGQRKQMCIAGNNRNCDDHHLSLDPHRSDSGKRCIADVDTVVKGTKNTQSCDNDGSESLFENCDDNSITAFQMETNSAHKTQISRKGKLPCGSEKLQNYSQENCKIQHDKQTADNLNLSDHIEQNTLFPVETAISMTVVCLSDEGTDSIHINDNGNMYIREAVIDPVSNDSTNCPSEQAVDDQVMSSTGDQALLMIDLSDVQKPAESVGHLSCQGQSISSDTTVAAGGLDFRDNLPHKELSSGFNKTVHPSTVDHCSEDKSSERDTFQSAQSRPAISLSGVLESDIVPSSLSLLRPTGLKSVSSTKTNKAHDVEEIHDIAEEISSQGILSIQAEQHEDASVITTAQTALENSFENQLHSGLVHPETAEGSSQQKGRTANNSISSKEEQCDTHACWKKVVDKETGQKTYINNMSGHTVSEDQWSEISSQVQKQMLAIPSDTSEISQHKSPAPLTASGKQALEDMVSRHFEQEDSNAMSKWRGGKRPVYNQEADADISALMAKWTNPVFLNYKEPTVIANPCPAGTAAKSCFNSLSQVEFSKDMLNSVKVIGQLDNKFIACLIERPSGILKAVSPENSNILVLFDQHAVHERIRLEHFTRESYVVQDGERTDRIQRSDLSSSQPLIMDQDDLRIMRAFSKEFDRIGISFTVDKLARNKVFISSVPACIAEKDGSEIKKNKLGIIMENVERMIKEHIDLLKSTNGACGRLPLAIHKVLCSQACHGAVKFGDPLTVEECQDLLSSLVSCNLPFQCAHGRPSVAPLINLTALEMELATTQRRPNLWKISQHFNK